MNGLSTVRLRLSGVPSSVAIAIAALAVGPGIAWAIASEHWEWILLVSAIAVGPILMLVGLPSSVALTVLALAAGPGIVWAAVAEQFQWVALLAVIAISPVVIRWPIAVGFGAFAFMLPFDSVALIADTGGATMTRFVGMGVALALLVTGVTQGRFVRPPRVAIWVTLLVLWAILSAAWALDVERAQGQAKTVISLVALYLVAVSYTVSEREVRTVCWLALIGGALAALGGVVLGFDAESDRAVRGTLSVGDTRANANGVAVSLLLPLAIGLGLFSRSRRLWAMIAAAAGVAAIAAGIFLTMSRGSLVAVVVMLCVWLYRYRSRPRSLVVVGLLLLLLPAMPDLFFERAGSVFDGTDPTGARRTDIWQIGLRALERFGVIGAGLSNFADAYIQTSYAGFGRYLAGHNTYLSTWVELGAVGLGLLLIVLFGNFRLSRSVKPGGSATTMAGALEAACCASLVVIFFGDWLWDKTLWMQWILIAWVSRAQMERAPVPFRATVLEPELVPSSSAH